MGESGGDGRGKRPSEGRVVAGQGLNETKPGGLGLARLALGCEVKCL